MYVWNICNFRHSKCHLEQFFLITYINYYNLHRHNYRTLNLYRSMYGTGRWLNLTVKTFHCVSLSDIWQCKKIWVSPVNLINDGKSVFLLPGNWQLFIWLHRRTPEGWINTTQQPSQWSALVSMHAYRRKIKPDTLQILIYPQLRKYFRSFSSLW